MLHSMTTVWVWESAEGFEVYASLDVVVREHNLTDHTVVTGSDGLRSINLGGYRNVIVECEVTE